MYQMKKEYYTGIELIDMEHTRLFEIAEEVYQLAHNDLVYDKYDGLIDLIGELTSYTKSHFAHEEEYMASINYKKMFTQKIQHTYFIEKLEAIDLDNLDDNLKQTIDEILTFLTEWLGEHIVDLDKQIAL